MNDIPNETTQLVKDIATELVLSPKLLSVRVVDLRKSFTINIEAGLSDSSRIIGSMGSHFNALTMLVKAIAAKHGYAAELAKVEIRGTKTDRYSEFKPVEKWPKEKVMSLVKRMAVAVFEHESEIEVQSKDGDSGTTMMDVVVSKGENAQLLAEMVKTFKTLVRPVGKANGRIIYLNIVPEKEFEPQPESSDGRHAKEISRR